MRAGSDPGRGGVRKRADTEKQVPNDLCKADGTGRCDFPADAMRVRAFSRMQMKILTLGQVLNSHSSAPFFSCLALRF